MSNDRPGVGRDRRKGPDTLTKSIRWVAVGGWILLVLAMIFIDYAKPDFVTVLDDTAGVPRNMSTTWNFTLARMIFYMMIAGFVFGLYGFFVNMYRSRRRNDRYRLNLLALASISLFGAVYYLLAF